MKPARLTLTALALAIPTAMQAQDAGIGETIYNQYCSTCHGADGAGAGPLTELLLEKPADLRKLAADNAASPGEFPMLRVIHIIDGRTGLRAHGGSMPTYGEIFMAEAIDEREQMGAVLETRGRILSLAMYLESIQE
jgi:mono/diheme cytochrome c family protein